MLSINQLQHQIDCVFLLEKCENLLQSKQFSHFSNKKKQCRSICNIYVSNFNEMLTNDNVNFEQPAPARTFKAGDQYQLQ